MLKIKWIRFWNNSLVVSIEIFLLLIFINIICMNNEVFLPLDEGWYVEIAWFEKMNCATLAMKEDILSFVVVVPVLSLRQLRQPFLNKTWMRWTYCNDNKISTGSSFAIHQRHGNVQGTSRNAPAVSFLRGLRSPPLSDRYCGPRWYLWTLCTCKRWMLNTYTSRMQVICEYFASLGINIEGETSDT